MWIAPLPTILSVKRTLFKKIETEARNIGVWIRKYRLQGPGYAESLQHLPPGLYNEVDQQDGGYGKDALEYR